MIGSWTQAQAMRHAQIARQNLEAYHRQQAEYHAYVIHLSRLGPRRYKCGPWRWTVTPIPETVLRTVSKEPKT